MLEILASRSCQSFQNKVTCLLFVYDKSFLMQTTAKHQTKGVIGDAIFSAIINTGSSNLRLETKVNDLTNEISRDDGAGHKLTSYWIDGSDRVEIFNGVCVLAKLKDYGKLQFFTFRSH
jgi:hypothetical protein